MPREDNLSAMRRFFELANTHDVEALIQLVHPRYIGESDVLAEPVGGRDAYGSLLRGYYAAFPDAKYEVEQMLVDGDCVVTRLRVSGTHLGDFMGNAPSGRWFEVRLCHVDEFKDGKIARAWYYWDTATMLRQLGIPAKPIAT